MRFTEKMWMNLLRVSGAALVLIVLAVFLHIIIKGAGSVSLEFLTQTPKKGMTEGGIYPAIIGSFLLTLLSMSFAVPLGVCSAIYLNEYASKGRLVRAIRLAIRNLSGVPSIVYGLFGLGLFVALLNFGHSLLSASLTLALLSLPITITASEEALKSVPDSFREGSFALGASKWESIRQNVLPNALPGIATGTILALARIIGETAPILLTGAAFFLPRLPNTIFDQFMSLPYHIFILSTQHSKIEVVRPIAYGTALVLIAIGSSLNLIAIMLRKRIRARKVW
jgi:phosphate transport system permease protein